MFKVDSFLELFSCPICFNCFNSHLFHPTVISCGHTICKDCINKLTQNNGLTCPIDKKKISILQGNIVKSQFNNNSIIKLLSMIDYSYINLKEFTKFSIYFCKDCNFFISNFVKDVHSTARHKVIKFSKYKLEKFNEFYKNYYADYKNNDKYLLHMSVVMHYFYNTKFINFFSLNYYNSFLIENRSNVNFSFIGHVIEDQDILFFTKFILLEEENQNLKNNQKFMKGVYQNENNEFIRGVFLIENKINENEDANKFVIIRSIGIFKDNSTTTTFVGVIDFKVNVNNQYDLILKYGILISRDHFYLGHFDESKIYPLYSLLFGEETNLLTNFTLRKLQTKFNFTQEENKLYNRFFSFENNILIVRKYLRSKINTSILESKEIYIFEFHLKSSFNINNIDLNIDNNINHIIIKKTNLFNNDLNNVFRIDPIEENNNLLSLNFSQTYITFLQTNSENILLKFINENSFILFNKFNKMGYVFKIKNEDLQQNNTRIKLFELFNKNIKEITSENIINSYLKLLDEFLYLDARNFEIEYKEIKDKEVQSDFYYIIDCEIGLIKHVQPKLNKEQIIIKEELKYCKIYQLITNNIKDEKCLPEIGIEIIKNSYFILSSNDLNNNENKKVTNQLRKKSKNNNCKCLIL